MRRTLTVVPKVPAKGKLSCAGSANVSVEEYRRLAENQWSEKEFSRQVISLAKTLGWKVAHFRPARVTRHGVEKYETPVGADGAGFPDLILIRGPRLLALELKSAKGRLTMYQAEWLDLFRAVPGCLAVVLRPADWPRVVELLA